MLLQASEMELSLATNRIFLKKLFFPFVFLF